jgi:hypothetical protein
MAAEDALFTIAEMAIGVAGFSAIVGAFTGSEDLTVTDRRRFVWLFTNAFMAALLAFVPVILHEAIPSGPELWRYSSLSMAVAWAVAAAAWIVDEVRQNRSDADKTKGFWQGPAALVPSFLNFVLQLANAFGLFSEPSAAVYIVGALVWLYSAALPFVSIVLERPAA